MTRLAARGKKRWCQDEACGLPFYDLNKVDFACPNCGAAYRPIAVVPIAAAGERYGRRSAPVVLPLAPLKPVIEPEAELAAEAEADADEPEADESGFNEVLLEPEDESDAVEIEPIAKDGASD